MVKREAIKLRPPTIDGKRATNEPTRPSAKARRTFTHGKRGSGSIELTRLPEPAIGTIAIVNFRPRPDIFVGRSLAEPDPGHLIFDNRLMRELIASAAHSVAPHVDPKYTEPPKA